MGRGRGLLGGGGGSKPAGMNKLLAAWRGPGEGMVNFVAGIMCEGGGGGGV